jgi:hypothetical protein
VWQPVWATCRIYLSVRYMQTGAVHLSRARTGLGLLLELDRLGQTINCMNLSCSAPVGPARLEQGSISLLPYLTYGRHVPSRTGVASIVASILRGGRYRRLWQPHAYYLVSIWIHAFRATSPPWATWRRFDTMGSGQVDAHATSPALFENTVPGMCCVPLPVTVYPRVRPAEAE